MESSEQQLPDNVLEAVHQGRKVEAIKRLRESQSMGLAEAKQVVDSYAEQNPHLITTRHHTGDSLAFRLFLALALVAAAAYAISSVT